MQDSFAEYKILGWQVFLSALWIGHPIAFWLWCSVPLLCLMRSLLLILPGFPWVIFPSQLPRFSLSLTFSIFTMYLGVDLFELTPIWICSWMYTSWMYRFMSFNLECFQPLFLWIFFCSFLLSWYSHYICLCGKGVPCFPEVLFIFLHSMFSLFFGLYNFFFFFS